VQYCMTLHILTVAQPENYVTVFSLRNWAKLRGDILTTEQVYIHAKVGVVTTGPGLLNLTFFLDLHRG
jgi:hypothetical protein